MIRLVLAILLPIDSDCDYMFLSSFIHSVWFDGDCDYMFRLVLAILYLVDSDCKYMFG